MMHEPNHTNAPLTHPTIPIQTPILDISFGFYYEINRFFGEGWAASLSCNKVNLTLTQMPTFSKSSSLTC
ncbi:hypothetical protein RIF29_12099 [Crotalaria pallida]|uniref:Uncharacterized protein n=1 Tax=Crotalaria pallida TaxID=3830 RepID=A0AAN9IMU2_CROPI